MVSMVSSARLATVATPVSMYVLQSIETTGKLDSRWSPAHVWQLSQLSLDVRTSVHRDNRQAGLSMVSSARLATVATPVSQGCHLADWSLVGCSVHREKRVDRRGRSLLGTLDVRTSDGGEASFDSFCNVSDIQFRIRRTPIVNSLKFGSGNLGAV